MSENDTNKSEEVDLGQLFTIIGNGIKSIFRFIGNIIYNIFAFILVCLLFLKKNLIILLIAAVLGFGYSLYVDYNGENVYEGTAIVFPNFQLEFQLQSRIDEYNQFLNVGDTLSLSKKLGIPLDKASSIRSFEMEPFFSVNKLRFEYYNYLKEQQDTTLHKRFTYEMYEEELRFEDYDEFEIRVVSTDKQIFKELGNKIWDFKDSENLLARKKRELAVLNSERRLLSNTLNSIDSTRATQRVAMLKEAERGNSTSTNIDMGDKEAYAGNVQIFSYERVLREDLLETLKSIENWQNLVNVTKSFPENGRTANLFNSKLYILYFIALAILIILLIQLWKYLNTLQSSSDIKYKKLG